MHWHVWPILSIITGFISITAPDVNQPVLSAKNIRLDVKFFPLFSYHLFIE
ncbi:hypothetical protein [Candidatus Hartigia pinicola]